MGVGEIWLPFFVLGLIDTASQSQGLSSMGDNGDGDRGPGAGDGEKKA